MERLTEAEKNKRIEFLKNEIIKVKGEYDFAKAMQLALKLVLNGSYGAFCHPAFSISNTNVANSITANAREVIVWMLDHIEDYFYNYWYKDIENHKLLGINYITIGEDGKYYYHKPDGSLVDEFGRKEQKNIFHDYHLDHNDICTSDKEEIVYEDKIYKVVQKISIGDFSNVRPLSTGYLIPPNPKSTVWDETRGVRLEPVIIYGDTDSCSSDTNIKTDNGEYTIEELYNKNVESGSAGITIKGHESVKCKEKVLNYNNGLYYAPVKRIIRHKVTKDKWLLKTKSGKEIIVTNDHSMIVFRNGIQLEIKPKDILKTDKILSIRKK